MTKLDADRSPEQLEALLARVSWLERERGIILFQEVPLVSRLSIDTLFGRVRELTAGVERFDIIVDLTEAVTPAPDLRAHLKHQLSRTPAIDHLAIFTGRNWLANVGAKFVVGRLTRVLTLHRTFEEAVEAVHRAQQR